MILLTGASGGIGRELVGLLAEMDQVVGLFNTTEPPSQTVAGLEYQKLNLEVPEEIQSFVQNNEDRLSRIVLIHGAAVKIDGLTANYKIDDWDRMIRVNLRAEFLLTQALLPYMIRERWGRIVHISSQGGIQGSPGTLAYSTCKTGLIGFSRVLAMEYARFKITSNVLVLGHFEVGLYNRLSDDIKETLLNQIPSRKLGKVSNIAHAIEFLIKSEFVNGAAINIDGGM